MASQVLHEAADPGYGGAPGLPQSRSTRQNRDASLYVRLDPEDRQLLARKALQRGMPSATYLSLLVRAHVRGVTPLPKEELLALGCSVTELKAVGRNLDQMAKALNQDVRATVPGRQEVTLLDIASYARPGPARRDRPSPAAIDLISRTIRRAPEVMVKVLTHGGRDLKPVQRYLAYIN
ncbi:MAG: hypothetical protein C5B58_06875 [Acidobacteria bacterium]|nr:MAG: hypothetical protein C5B58_06875 [Acidobacteriota bacterium]